MGHQREALPLQLTFAKTAEQQAWGLMDCKQLDENRGMLFFFSPAKISALWMFNCYIDLSVAYLDNQGTILEIHDLKAYPHFMDKKRPVRTLEDLDLYPSSDPIYRFFMSKAIRSKTKVSYALEVNHHWFKRYGIGIGDRLEWDGKGRVYIIKNMIEKK